MGSAATSDMSLMTKLMKTLHQQRLFFLDSRTIGSSVAAKAAKEQGVVALTRHIFLMTAMLMPMCNANLKARFNMPENMVWRL